MSNPFETTTPPTVQPKQDNPEQVPDELKLLKQRADMMGVQYSNNIGIDTLKQKIKEHQDKVDREDSFPASDEVASDEQISKELSIPATKISAQEERKQYRDENLKLIRLRITNMNPAKAALKGEILTVANSVLGKVSKYVPYGDECGEDGFHVPNILYQFMKERVFAQIKTSKRGYPTASDVKEFALEVLPPLTQKELRALALKQAAASGATEKMSSDD